MVVRVPSAFAAAISAVRSAPEDGAALAASDGAATDGAAVGAVVGAVVGAELAAPEEQADRMRTAVAPRTPSRSACLFGNSMSPTTCEGVSATALPWK